MKIFVMYQRLSSKKDKLAFIRNHRDNIKTRGTCCYRVPEEGSVLWPKQHPHGEPCLKCPKCLTLPALNRLNKICSHLALLQAKENPDKCVEGSTAHFNAEVELTITKALLPLNVLDSMPGKYLRESSIMNNHSALSGKFHYLGLILDRIIGQNEKVLIFSNFTSPLDLIENFLESKGYPSLRIDGSTPSAQREDIKAEFKKETSAFILLLSKKAMGVGVTLTTANNVIMFDVDWNPATDSQAQDRSYRIGQDRNVNVYRLVARGTVEEMMYLRQLYKEDLTNQTLGGGDSADAERGRFRGVHADKERKGELFGLENLLKFKDGTFMKYKRNADRSLAHGRCASCDAMLAY
jgi:DNA excision repair protein ERCC-6-like 2